MKTVTKHIYASYNAYSASGILYSLADEGCSDYYEGDEDYRYVCDVEIPEIDKSFVVECAVSQLDKENAALQAKIADNNAKKQQLLCIEHQEGK